MTNTSSSKTIKYRPDIDCPRAMAALAVLIFPAFPKKLPGGFVGVNLFFVISGYLITSIILNDLVKTIQHKNLSGALRQAFPPLIFVLLTSFIFGLIALLPNEL